MDKHNKNSKCNQDKCAKSSENYNLHKSHSDTECGTDLSLDTKNCGATTPKNCK